MTELVVSGTRILIIGDDTHVSRMLVAALIHHESRMRGFEPTTPVIYPVLSPSIDELGTATIEQFQKMMESVRSISPVTIHDEPMPTYGRVRMGKGEKRRLKKQRGW